MSLLSDGLTQLGTELRIGLRDPHILLYAVLTPLFLYPALIFAVFQVVSVRAAREQFEKLKLAAPVASQLPDAPEGSPSPTEFLARLQTARRVYLSRHDDIPSGDEALRSYLEQHELDGVVTFQTKKDKLVIRLLHVSLAGRLPDRFEEIVSHYRKWFTARLLRSKKLLGTAPTISYRNAATSRQMGDFILSRLLPVTLIIFLGTGAFYAAIDVTAGERERGTFETTLLLPIRRDAIVLGKFGYVLIMGMLAAFVNLVSLTLTLGHAMKLLGGNMGIAFRLTPTSLFASFIVFFALALAIVPLILGLAFQTRSFREGQSYVGPVYALLILPTVVVALPGMGLTASTAFIPVVNVTLALREVLQGRIQPLLLLAVLTETLLIGLLLIAAAVKMLDREDLWMNPQEPGLRALLRIFRPGASPR